VLPRTGAAARRGTAPETERPPGNDGCSDDALFGSQRLRYGTAEKMRLVSDAYQMKRALPLTVSMGTEPQ
jgi:hypothetical protein